MSTENTPDRPDDASNDDAAEATVASRPRRRRVTRRRLLIAGGVVAGGTLAIPAVGIAAYLATLYPGLARHTGVLAVRGARVLVGQQLEPVDGATVLVQDGRITAVGPDVQIPQGAEVLDRPGATVLPGLIDMHTHLAYPEIDEADGFGPADMPGYFWDYLRSFPQMRRTTLEHGVTSVRSLGDELAWVLDLRDAIASGELEGPRIFCAGPVLTTPGGHPISTHGTAAESDAIRLPRTPADAESVVGELLDGDRPVDVIKVIHESGASDDPLDPHDPAVLAAIVESAHARDVPVTVHCGAVEDLSEVLDSGADGIEHLSLHSRSFTRDEIVQKSATAWPEGMLERIVESGAVLDPTVMVEAGRRARTDSAAAGLRDRIFERVREAHEAGASIVAGSDAAVPGVESGLGLREEIEALGAAGLSPREALRSATSVAASALGSTEVGVIKADRAADLLLVDGDPLEDLTALREVSAVLREGRLVVDATA